jgi:hypothetical protein
MDYDFTTGLSYNFELVQGEMCCKGVVELKAKSIKYFPHYNGMNFI